MKVLFRVELVGDGNSRKVYKLFEMDTIPTHNSIVCFPSGPNRRLQDDIDSDNIGLSFRIDAKNIAFNVENNLCVIETVDETMIDVPLKQIVRIYSECEWRVQ